MNEIHITETQVNHISKIATYFDTPFRSTVEEIEQSKRQVISQPILSQMLEGFPNLAVVLDANRQIIAYNKKAESILNPDKSGSIYGQRVGEAIQCIHAFDMPAGCGTSTFCSECGAGKCNKFTKDTLQSCTEECRITVNQNGVESSLDLKVFTSVINIDNINYILFSIEDIKDEKRRKILEKIFFHDVLNTATAIYGMSEIIKETDKVEDIDEFKHLLFNSSGQLIKEIEMQRDLINAECGKLNVNIQSTSVNKILSKAFELYKNHELTQGTNYNCEFLNSDVNIKTDEALLIRSLGNLIRNALEAVNKKGNVKILVLQNNGHISFNIKNDSIIPENIKLQIFQRSFSTKAKSGRGIGTYSVKLLVEQYLGGSVSFISNSDSGTIFSVNFLN